MQLKLPDISLYAVEQSERDCAIYLQLLSDSQRAGLIPYLVETGYAILYKGVHFYLEELSVRNASLAIPPIFQETPSTRRQRWRYSIDTSNPSKLMIELGKSTDGLHARRISEVLRRCVLVGFLEIVRLRGENNNSQIDARLLSPSASHLANNEEPSVRPTTPQETKKPTPTNTKPDIAAKLDTAPTSDLVDKEEEFEEEEEQDPMALFRATAN